jgi:hypothetical protein
LRALDVQPDDGGDHNPHSIEVAADASLTLKWDASGASGVHIDGLGDFDSSGSQPLPTQDATYSLVALGGGAQSDPWPLKIHVHDPGDVVSQHVDVQSGVVSIVSFCATKDGAPATAASAGDSLELYVSWFLKNGTGLPDPSITLPPRQ